MPTIESHTTVIDKEEKVLRGNRDINVIKSPWVMFGNSKCLPKTSRPYAPT